MIMQFSRERWNLIYKAEMGKIPVSMCESQKLENRQSYLDEIYTV